MKRLSIALLFLLVPLYVHASDLRDKVKSTKNPKQYVIDPDKHIYGVPFGSSEDELIKKFGDPTGYIKFTNNESGIIYGKKHIFLFYKGKLSGIQIGEDILDWRLANKVQPNVFDSADWEVLPGIKENMTKDKLKQILGDRLKSSEFAPMYETNSSTIRLHIIGVQKEGETEYTQFLDGITLEMKNP